VTLLPGMGTKELAELNRQREEAFRAMTWKEKQIAMGQRNRRRGGSAILTAEEKKERQREQARKWYTANKEKKAAYDRERRERAKQAGQAARA
jgi:hypothetical protein